MTIRAKYAGTCGECGQAIQVGAQVEWSKGSPARHTACAGNGAAKGTVDGQRADLGQHWSSRGRGPVVRLCAGGCGRRVSAKYGECYSCHRESVEAM